MFPIAVISTDQRLSDEVKAKWSRIVGCAIVRRTTTRQLCLVLIYEGFYYIVNLGKMPHTVYMRTNT